VAGERQGDHGHRRQSDIGVLYGVFRYLELIQTRQPVDSLDIVGAPKVRCGC
jgi:alpha-glucuronidase